MGFGAYLLDIEGTTTPIDFVTRTLFPFARERMAAFLASPSSTADPEVASAINQLGEDFAAESGAPPLDIEGGPLRLLPYVEWLMDQDRKSTGLKTIQGKIWEAGYASGELVGEVYPDVLPAIRRWRAAGARVAIFSSGSILAQKLLFGHLAEGDATPLIDAFFDTTTGPKREPASYRAIAGLLGLNPGRILFLSDVEEEITAARGAGLSGCRVVRDGPAAGFPDSVSKFEPVP